MQTNSKSLLLFLATSLVAATFISQQAEAESDADRPLLVSAARQSLSEGEYQEAEEIMRRVVEKYSSAEPQARSIDMQNLALILYSESKFQAATDLYLQALPLTESCWGQDSLEVADNLYGIARSMRRGKKYVEAEPHMFRILDIKTKKLGSTHKGVGNALLDIAVNYERQGKYEQAESYCSKALAIKEKQFAKDSSNNVHYLEQYAGILRKLNRNDQAQAVENRAQSLKGNPSTPEPRDYSDKSGWLTWPQSSE